VYLLLISTEPGIAVSDMLAVDSVDLTRMPPPSPRPTAPGWRDS
jgi:hypothetical protein